MLGVGLQEEEDQIPVVVLIKRHRTQILLDHACNRLGNGPVLGDVYDVKVVGDFCVVVPEESKFRVGWWVEKRDACTFDTLADRRDDELGEVAQTQDLLDHLTALEEAVEWAVHLGGDCIFAKKQVFFKRHGWWDVHLTRFKHLWWNTVLANDPTLLGVETDSRMGFEEEQRSDGLDHCWVD